MKVISSRDRAFPLLLSSIAKRGEKGQASVEGPVKAIIEDVRKRGDEALFEYTERFDCIDLRKKGLRKSDAEMRAAFEKIPKQDVDTLRLAARRIESFHRKELRRSWYDVSPDGTILGQKVTALKRVGIYVPGGKAAYPSTVLMNAIPARVAGVEEVYIVTPPGKGGVNPHVLAASRIAGVTAVFSVGGAQAIAALAFGTESVPMVDKVVGPGNIYVATAKRLVFGAVDIDMIAGPSEILVINDGTGDAGRIAADLLSQAEHDELAASYLVTTSMDMAREVGLEVQRQMKTLKRRKIAEEAIRNYGVIIIAGDLGEAARISDDIAPEHLELFVKNPRELLAKVRNAGAIFLGANTPEAMGDYLAGPNHTLPTGGCARFSSALGTDDFTKRSSVIGFSRRGFKSLAGHVERFAGIEGLDGHARSVAARLKKRQTRRGDAEEIARQEKDR